MREMLNAKIQIPNLTFELGHLDFCLLPEITPCRWDRWKVPQRESELLPAFA